MLIKQIGINIIKIFFSIFSYFPSIIEGIMENAAVSKIITKNTKTKYESLFKEKTFLL
ncbi:hypothetical protein [Haloimpatiens myeolchijeotgali]|uniref:hypothetical protein n=1 Tax=Haloimpatiens sp. FM7330 TaxID=3298610 RepID=UPI00384FFEAE